MCNVQNTLGLCINRSTCVAPLLTCVVFVAIAVQMHENKYLHLPVLDGEQHTVVGVVNVMEIVQATAGAKDSARYALQTDVGHRAPESAQTIGCVSYRAK